MVERKMENSYEYYRKVKAQFDAQSAFNGNNYF